MKRASMEKVSIIGLDLAKRRLQAHGARTDGGVAFRKKLSRDKVLSFLAEHPRCVVAMEACGSAHHWGRAIGARWRSSARPPEKAGQREAGCIACWRASRGWCWPSHSPTKWRARSGPC